MKASKETNEKRQRTAMSAAKLRLILMGAIGALFLNNLMITSNFSRQLQTPTTDESQMLSGFKTASRTTKGSINDSKRSTSNDQKLRTPRILMGIFSSDNMFDATHRKWHRQLFNDIWKDRRVCTLNDFRYSDDRSVRERCQLIYTFVIGANLTSNVTERLEETDTVETPIELPELKDPLKTDANWPDVTHLNIRENMNEGKSQTWFYFASKISKTFETTSTPIDYVMKFDSDSILKLFEFLEFADTRLPPSPYNKNIFSGALRDKGPWYFKDSALGHPKSELPRFESYWGKEFDGVHLYLAGQSYLMSTDLASFVAKEAPLSKIRVGAGGYIENHEDHDISAMVWHNPNPITLVTIGKSQRYWEHPVKGAPRFLKIVEREKARVNGELFQGKVLKLY